MKLLTRIPSTATLLRVAPVLVPAILLSMLLVSPSVLARQEAADVAGFGGGIAVLAIGFLFGLKHALDADHLVAVSAIVSERSSPWSASIVGGLWGLGHTASLLIAGLIVIVLRIQVPETLALWLEFGVAAMIVGLGIDLVRKLLIGDGARLSMTTHSHGTLSHRHPHVAYEGAEEQQLHASWRGLGRKPFLVGMVHGLAGSAALMLLVLTEIRSPELGLLYILVFGLGSVGGMLVMSTLFSIPYLLVARRFARVDYGLRIAAGIFSIAFGGWLMYEIGIGEGLFWMTF